MTPVIRDFAEVRTFQEATLSAQALHGEMSPPFNISVSAALINGMRRILSVEASGDQNCVNFLVPG
jgi:hypothetical protein